jgi:hypothetical protein
MIRIIREGLSQELQRKSTEFRTTGMYAGTTRRRSERETLIAYGDPLLKGAKGALLPG